MGYLARASKDRCIIIAYTSESDVAHRRQETCVASKSKVQRLLQCLPGAMGLSFASCIRLNQKRTWAGSGERERRSNHSVRATKIRLLR
jgi:hypothetical protein